MPTYKTKDGIDRIIPGIGRTVDGLITTDALIENPMFEVVDNTTNPVAPTATPATAQVAQPASAPAPTIEQIAQNINTQNKEQLNG